MVILTKNLATVKHMVDVSLCVPTLLLGYRQVSDIDLKEVGFRIGDCDSTLSFSVYDYGHTFELKLLGFGISVWWL